eukprot:3572686-Amphidinium_carterae.3
MRPGLGRAQYGRRLVLSDTNGSAGCNHPLHVSAMSVPIVVSKEFMGIFCFRWIFSDAHRGGHLGGRVLHTS